jgi:hypothetical protein
VQHKNQFRNAGAINANIFIYLASYHAKDTLLWFLFEFATRA